MKRAVFATLLLILMLSLSMAAQLPNYTMADVAKHNSSTDCWLVLNKTEVYNVTAFLSVHPAGAAPITPYCGADATTAFNNVGHSSSAVAMEATYLIGNLVASAISVSVSPTTATVTAGQTQSFTATVTGSTKGVTWTSTSVGTIDQNGLFTAVTAGTGTVTATSVEDTTKSATAQVTVKSSGGGGGGVSVSLTPATASVSVGGTQQFTANVTGSSSGVTWTVTGAVGTVDANGMFTATKAGMGVVKATSVSDPTKSASASVSVTQSGAGCSLTSARGSFSINCIPASAIPSARYTCTAKSSGNSTVVQCRAASGSGGGGRGGDD
ncbi:MAG TPA: cytochrome b5-like heme/steroid binding domain-containing protein [Candidatus Sulfotelmatobacter sp.]|nr:cytochrome b5-like heme/steroid binding domain-containing protein [Candidatus Sulfotelmatobacter sp.]